MPVLNSLEDFVFDQHGTVKVLNTFSVLQSLKEVLVEEPFTPAGVDEFKKFLDGSMKLGEMAQFVKEEMELSDKTESDMKFFRVFNHAYPQVYAHMQEVKGRKNV